mmetsp:Transcript_31682/g.90025  ORF Transcript_31682/g.90025 Transcript_31682/m.90025 type:complete len:481 (+) Transcript_31682:108-1550(+)
MDNLPVLDTGEGIGGSPSNLTASVASDHMIRQNSGASSATHYTSQEAPEWEPQPDVDMMDCSHSFGSDSQPHQGGRSGRTTPPIPVHSQQIEAPSSSVGTAAAAGVAAAATHETMHLLVSPFLPPCMQRKCWRIGDFIVQKRLYEGYSSTVSQALDKVSGNVVALKIYDKARLSELNRAQVEREIRIHIELQHMYIVQLYAAWEDERVFYLVQEFASEGDVFTEVHRRGGQLSEKAAVSLVLQPFLAALHYLHTKKIIHRDIKPENLLFAAGKQMRVADFGLAINQSQERPVTRAGTLDYMAPEVVVCPSKRTPKDNKDNDSLVYNEQVDSWSVGILAYELIVGFPPFERESRAATLECIMYTEPQFPMWMSDEAIDFIKKALSKDRTRRPTIPEMLKHPWVQIHERRRSHRIINTAGLSFADSNSRQMQGVGAGVPAMPSGQFRQTTSFGLQSLFANSFQTAPMLPEPPQASPNNTSQQ